MRRKFLQGLFWAVSVLMIAGVCLFAIPDGLNDLEIERVTLRELIPASEHYYLYLTGERSTTATIVPATAVTNLTWVSGDESIVTVRSTETAVSVSDAAESRTCDFVLSGVGLGTTRVTVSSDNGLSVSFNVTVVRAPLPPDSDLPPLYYDPVKVVNVNNTIGSDYIPELLIVPEKYAAYIDMQMTPETFEAYERMYADCLEATGERLRLMSSYRSYAKQQQLYNADITRLMRLGYSEVNAKAVAGKTQQPPGCSEHQLGNSLDLGQVAQRFGNTPAGKWSHAHAHEYGFILRYPSGKEDITGISYEAWHFRYVGVEHATYIYEHDLCLEEYVQLQQEAAELAIMYADTLSDTEFASVANSAK